MRCSCLLGEIWTTYRLPWWTESGAALNTLGRSLCSGTRRIIGWQAAIIAARDADLLLGWLFGTTENWRSCAAS